MSRAVMYALVLPLFAAECWARFVAHNGRWTAVLCLLASGVLAVRYALGPQTRRESQKR